MKKLILVLFIGFSVVTCIAQVPKEPIANDTLQVTLSKWQLETIAEIQKQQQELQKLESIVQEKYKLLISSAVDQQGVEFKNVSDVYIKNNKLFILKKKEPIVTSKKNN